MSEARWKIAIGDADEYPAVSVWGRPAKRMYWIYSLWDGSTVAYVPRFEDALAIVGAHNAALLVDFNLREETRPSDPPGCPAPRSLEQDASHKQPWPRF